MSKGEVQKILNQAKLQKEKLQLQRKSKVFQEYVLFMDYQIRNQMNSFSLLSICGGEKRNKFIIDERFSVAFKSLSLKQKATYYYNSITFAFEGSQNNISINENHLQNQEKEVILLINKGFASWEEVKITINDFKIKISDKVNIDVRNYLLRASKKRDRKCWVLEAIHQSNPELVRFSFRNSSEEYEFYPIIQKLMSKAHFENITKMTEVSKIIKPIQKILKCIEKDSNILKLKEVQSELKLQSYQKSEVKHHILQQILKQTQNQDLSEQLPQLVEKLNQLDNQSRHNLQIQSSNSLINKKRYYRSLFKLILPNYNLRTLDQLAGFTSVYCNHAKNIYIYQSIENRFVFKMEMTHNLSPENLMKILYNAELLKAWNPQIMESQMKMLISSQNTGIIYYKQKSFSQWYRQRDFLFIRHLFILNNVYYLVEKSIENNSYVPFYSIERGNLNYAVWKVSGSPNNQNSSSFIVEIDLRHGGMLNKVHQEELTLRYLKGFQNIIQYFKDQNLKKLKQYLGFHWITNPQSTQNELLFNTQRNENMSVKTQDFQNGSQIQGQINQDQYFYSIPDINEQSQKDQNQEKSEHQINEKQLQQMRNSYLLNQKMDNINFDKNGLVILPTTYLNKRHKTTVFQNVTEERFFKYPNVLLKNDWEHLKQGGLKLINERTISALNNVIKFIMSTLQKNIFSGKGITGICLPVDIFHTDSNLQFASSILTLAPHFLQRASKLSAGVNRMKQMIGFGVSNIILYFDILKPFNPILGQTYQCWINGCPVYAQQVSHHPPITSIYMVGRGYKVYASFQSKVDIHINSGGGINDGYCNVVFDDGQKIICQSPKGQLTGLAIGDRKFGFKGKSYFLDSKNSIYAQIRFEKTGGFFSPNWQFSDQVEGEIIKVTPDFVNRFLHSQQKISPRTSDITQTFSKISGRWPISILIDGKRIYGIDDDIPFERKDEPYPLPSNSTYREDIVYRKKEDFARSQIEKQRLEIIQRNDKKLRAKHQGSSH